MVVYKHQNQTHTVCVGGLDDLIQVLLQIQNLDPTPMAWEIDLRTLASTQQPNK